MTFVGHAAKAFLKWKKWVGKGQILELFEGFLVTQLL